MAFALFPDEDAWKEATWTDQILGWENDVQVVRRLEEGVNTCRLTAAAVVRSFHFWSVWNHIVKCCSLTFQTVIFNKVHIGSAWLGVGFWEGGWWGTAGRAPPSFHHNSPQTSRSSVTRSEDIVPEQGGPEHDSWPSVQCHRFKFTRWLKVHYLQTECFWWPRTFPLTCPSSENSHFGI